MDHASRRTDARNKPTSYGSTALRFAYPERHIFSIQFLTFWFLNPAPGLGALVPIFGLIGFPGFWLSFRRTVNEGLATVTYALTMMMMGLAGLVLVTFLNNRLMPDLAPDAVQGLFAAIRSELLVIGLVFLVSAWLLLFVAWRSDARSRAGAIFYALGALPVSLPPLVPETAIVIGGLTVASGLIIWGVKLLITGGDD